MSQKCEKRLFYQNRLTRGKIATDKILEKHSDIVELLNEGKSIRKIAELTKKGI